MRITKILLLLFLVAGCDSVLTEEPKTFLSEDKVFSSQAGLESATKGVYATLREFDYYNRWFTGMVEMHADYVNGRGSQSPVGRYELDATNINRIGLVWTVIYESINRANVVIANAPEVEMNPTLRDQFIAEARFLRTLGYYNLVRLWGAVPLRDAPATTLDEMSIPRTPVDEVYDLIIADLQFGEERLPDAYDQSDLGRATKWAAKTLLADVYLTRERWSEAAAKAKEVIDSGRFSLVRVETSEDFHEKIFGPDVLTHSEEILSIKYTQDLQNTMLNWLHRSGPQYSPGGTHAWWGELKSWIGQGTWATEDSPDLRRNSSLYNGPDMQHLDEAIPMLFRKFRGSPANIANDLPLLRYPEALFIFAEATSQASGGPTPEAYEALNKVRRRAYGKDPNVPDPEADLAPDLSAAAFRDTVLLERAKEFVLENKRWFDLLRTDTALEVIQGLGKPITEKNLKWPIPAEEIDNNDALTQADQNPGW